MKKKLNIHQIQEIKRLRSEGFSHREIGILVGCSRRTSEYHNQNKEQIRKRVIKNRIKHFNKKSSFDSYSDSILKYDQVIKKYGDEITCSLSGIALSWDDPSHFEFDHIIPRAMGGENSIENFQILHKQVNRIKGKLDEKELISICKDIYYNNLL